jgi:hypothetical protein
MQEGFKFRDGHFVARTAEGCVVYVRVQEGFKFRDGHFLARTAEGCVCM